MTDRFHSLTVVLEHDMRDDDADLIIIAIGMIKGVLSVSGEQANAQSIMAESRAKNEFRRLLLETVT